MGRHHIIHNPQQPDMSWKPGSLTRTLPSHMPPHNPAQAHAARAGSQAPSAARRGAAGAVCRGEAPEDWVQPTDSVPDPLLAGRLPGLGWTARWPVSWGLQGEGFLFSRLRWTSKGCADLTRTTGSARGLLLAGCLPELGWPA